MLHEISHTLFPYLAFLIPLAVYLWTQNFCLRSVINEPTQNELKSGERRFTRFHEKYGPVLTKSRAFSLSLKATLPAIILAAGILFLAYPYWSSLMEETKSSQEGGLLLPVLLWVPLFLFYFLTHFLQLPFMLLVNKVPGNACARYFVRVYRYFFLFLFLYCVIGIYLSF